MSRQAPSTRCLGRAGFVLRRGTGTITAAAATAEDARWLGLRPGDPLLVERRVIADGHGRAIEATESRYVAERYGLDVQFDVETRTSTRDRTGDRERPTRPRRSGGGGSAVDRGRPISVDLRDRAEDGPYLAPGFVDVHVHGWGGHDAMGDAAALDGMARALLRRGVTSFLPTAVTAPLDELTAFAERVRWLAPAAPADGAEPLGFNLEGPFLAPARRGAHAAAHLATPADAPRATARARWSRASLITIAPELPGATDLIGWLHGQGVAVSIGHSAAASWTRHGRASPPVPRPRRTSSTR